ncbi:protein translocase subunit SecF [Campylobacter sp. FMV-PI01]|uniref:Protein-export membrane protein SecF n=1 Tax=Campylobacter portucalensis TaxID=2608384 RepID=A0A6L5WG97_9BACT|nr:protein translocase subunit SecF [Campylobacter portucalensis]MSN96054.1 protein translocase subunit SecF [Campylobacter portucalensis]
MQIFDKDKIYNFMGVRYIFLGISIFLMIASVVLLCTNGVKYGIDFSGGTLIQIKYEEKAPIENIRTLLEEVEHLKGVSVTEFGSDEEITIRYAGSSDSLGQDPGANIAKMLQSTGKFEVRRVDIVGPKVGNELRQSGLMAIVVSFVLILIYIAFRFEWRFALAAIISEIHDVLITIGIIALLGINVNLDTLAAILTVIGYSLNDTIIVFDRIREGVQESKENEISKVINESVSKTLSRTILTSFTTLISVVVLYLFGGDMIKDFSFIMMVGVIVGTFSSVFIAAQTLIILKFNVVDYRALLAEKLKRKKDKEKMRAMYEKGIV